MTIVYSFNDAYAMPAAVSLLSLLTNNREIATIKIVIVDDNLSADNRAKIEMIAASFVRDIIFLDLERVTAELDIETSFHRNSYARLFLSSVLKDDVAYYFDSDTIITGSLLSLSNISLDNYAVAGVQDTVNPAYLTGIGLKRDDTYINSGGVIALNLKYWRANGLQARCIDFIKQHKGSPPHNDQGTLNIVCNEEKLILNPEYNVMNPMFMFNTKQIKGLFRMKRYYSQAEIDCAKSSPVVIHYTEELYNRPWFSNCRHPLKEIFIGYLSQSPWADTVLPFKKMSRNASIQKRVYRFAPFFVYLLMIRFVEFRRRAFKPDQR